jgi:uncharacterized protein YjbI with pentapeptide repeats
MTMANEEHLKILRQGVEAWNRWRKENPDVRPDLKGAVLEGADLSGAYLVMADFREANLSETDLSAANLNGADLEGADLSETDLSEADLRGADLSQTDLSQAHLRGAHLREAWLSWADLVGANLYGADLIMASLTRADLSRADLSGADLSRASLSGADLSRAFLREADLSRVDLREANLSRVDLSGADFREADVGYTAFVDLDLSVVKGLDTVKHRGPSHISIDTIYRSHGQIPEAFLRGCGVPDNFIAYMGSLTGKAFEYYSCFISHSTKDQAFAERLYNDLQGKGVRCWFAPEDMKIGDKIRPRIDESIRIHDKLLLILLEHSVASEWVEHEVEHALDLERERKAPVLFPIRLDDAVMKSKIGWAGNIQRGRHIGDFCTWKDHDSYQRAFDRLLRDLKAEEG